jgi:hypothetical protein
LPLAAKPVRGLHQPDQAGGSNRTDAGNLTQQFLGFMFPATAVRGKIEQHL